jgi:hypothetical protein
MTDFTVGFTGSQTGMTDAQRVSVADLLEMFRADRPRPRFNYGFCVGADDQAAMIAGNLGYQLHAYPGDNPNKRGKTYPHVLHGQQPNLVRNAMIVGDSTVLIATPAQRKEIRRSGTWATVRAARKAVVPVWIVWPDGAVESR